MNLDQFVTGKQVEEPRPGELEVQYIRRQVTDARKKDKQFNPVSVFKFSFRDLAATECQRRVVAVPGHPLSSQGIQSITHC